MGNTMNKVIFLVGYKYNITKNNNNTLWIFFIALGTYYALGDDRSSLRGLNRVGDKVR